MNLEFNKRQLDRLTEFISNVGVVFFATIITPFFTGNMINYFIVIVGLGLSLLSIFISLFLLK
jgi:hypothetical protein